MIWPAMLMAAGLEVPKRIWVHGWVLVGGSRVSKSIGGNLDLREAIARNGADAFRYFLLREVPFDGDGNFSWERFDERYNSDLARLGNLASRTISSRSYSALRAIGQAQWKAEADEIDLEAYPPAFGPRDSCCTPPQIVLAQSRDQRVRRIFRLRGARQGSARSLSWRSRRVIGATARATAVYLAVHAGKSKSSGVAWAPGSREN